MSELPRRNIGQDRRAGLPPDRQSGINDEAKLAAARAALARAAAAHRADTGDDKEASPPESPARFAGRDEAVTVPAPPDDSPPPGPRRPRTKWIAVAAAVAIAVTAAGVAVTIGGTRDQADRQSHAADELRQSDVTELATLDTERLPSSSASAARSSLPASSNSATPSGQASDQETSPATDKAAGTDAKATASKTPHKDGTDREDDLAAAPGRALVVEASGNCLTGAGSGSELVVAACTGANTQLWSIGSGTALQQGGLCATVTGTEDRTPVVLTTCDRSAAQRLSLSGKSLLSASTSKCLDLFGGASGTQVVLWECNGRDNQRWSSS
ncbi:ricin-type beta-trefoil lectin domain protein [Streptomyces sp. NPDC096323]|uniref:ricin-type beta-trefoil lectin domain protein n=1 Tax=Streptomyces sp. NPDC096323 TaxID=3155822 RepID=UPI00332B7C34